MASVFKVFAAVSGAMVLMASVVSADPLPESEIRAAMATAERMLVESGVNGAGYSATPLPQVERVSPSHINIQGNDGAYVDGKIYISESAIADCQGLILLHEIVHDATIKLGLFKAVPNDRIRDMIEALADQMTETAAQDPYRPGCVTHRNREISSAELISLAMN
jgi:hypothetical protein